MVLGSSQVTIRFANAADVPALLPLIDKICALHQAWDASKYGFLPEPGKHYESWLISQIETDRSVVLVAETQPDAMQTPSHLVGFLIATTEEEIPIYYLPAFGFVHDLWVEPAYRQQGIARQLVLWTIDCFRRMGIEQIRLDVAMRNQAAANLFRSCGFRPSTQEMLIELKDSWPE
ncbi:MAG: GNAT family N-acetyltransferase [Scytolyngbya sp. HA4215-MV1]|jgi:ribosomal protein S18 acetylase RimI-like enzyme|nr:GNAT family N-acetyltransferase [Scytolyngbya sp. HA4215-MV1]